MHGRAAPLVRWLYLVALAHVLVGVVLTWCNQGLLLRPITRASNGFSGPQCATGGTRRAGVVDRLFGATVQSMSLWMGALVHLGNIHRSRFAWAA